MKPAHVRCGVVALLLGSTLGWATAYAGTVAAPTCSQSDVQAAVDAANDGDTVSVPAGDCTWDGGVSWKNKNVAVIGAGRDATTIHCQGCFGVTSDAPTSDYSRWRISGMTLAGPNPDGLVITIWDNVEAWHYGWRIDHMRFDYPGAGSGYGIFVGGATYGVIDNNEWQWGNGLAIIVAAQMANEYPGSIDHPQGGYVLSQPLDLGTEKAVYIEDNVFESNAPNGLAAYDTSSGGGRAVFRHNTVKGGIYYSHWTRTLEVGGVLHEVYNNHFIGNAAFNAYPIRIEAGTGVIFNNTITGYESIAAVVDERRGFLESSEPLGACDGSRPWDGNAGDPAAPGWPCLGQIGRAPGKSMAELMAGDKQASAPLTLWNNGAEDGCRSGGACTDAMVVSVYDGSNEATAYVRATPHPNGEVDYVLNGSTPKDGYVPFTYPHPLRGERPIDPSTSATTGSGSGAGATGGGPTGATGATGGGPSGATGGGTGDGGQGGATSDAGGSDCTCTLTGQGTRGSIAASLVVLVGIACAARRRTR